MVPVAASWMALDFGGIWLIKCRLQAGQKMPKAAPSSRLTLLMELRRAHMIKHATAKLTCLQQRQPA